MKRKKEARALRLSLFLKFKLPLILLVDFIPEYIGNSDNIVWW
jgi:hypothetical protein